MKPASHPAVPSAGEKPTRLDMWQAHIERLVELVRPWSWLWPPMALADGTIRPPAGVPGLDMRRFLPGPEAIDAPTGEEAPVTGQEVPIETVK